MTTARETFAAMSFDERQNLARLAYWTAPDHQRRQRDYLIGPQYVALRAHGVIRWGKHDLSAGETTIITDHGRAVIHYIEGGL